MTAKIDGTNGLIQQYDYQVLTTAFTYTFAAGTTVLVINPAGTLATGTITFPAAPADGMTVIFSSTQAITALTLAGNGKTIVSAVTALLANQAASYVYRLSNTSWYPITDLSAPGVTSAVAGNGVSVSAATGAVTFAAAAPTFNTVGSYCFGIVTTVPSTVITSGASYAAGSSNTQVQSAIIVQNTCTGSLNFINSNNLSGTWRYMGGAWSGNSVNNFTNAIFVRIS